MKMVAERFTDWQKDFLDKSMKNDPLPILAVKSFGVGAIEGTVLGLAAASLIAIIVNALPDE